MNTLLKKEIEEWQSIRQLTLDLLENLPEEYLTFVVGKRMGTLGKQFRHIGDVQLCYSDALKTGTVSFETYKRDYSIETSKEKLLLFLQETDKEMFRLLEESPETKVLWFGEELSLEEHLHALTQHEILHQGELVVYIRTLEIPFPQSWSMWGL